jgi:hypothetical protein
VIIRSRDEREVERVREFDDVRLPPLDHSNALGCGVAQLHCVQSREAARFVFRKPGKVARNGEYEERCPFTRSECRVVAAHRVVPVALGINRECGVDADCDDVLVLVSRLERRKQYRSVASTHRVQRRGGDRTSESLVIADVRDIESRSGVPRAITLRCEPFVAVPG